MSQSDISKSLERVRHFLNALPGEAGLTATGVDRLCALAHGRKNIKLPRRIDIEDEREITLDGESWEYI